jgi:transcriptional regulator
MVLQADAKVKDDHNPVEDRERVIGRLEERCHGLDVRAAMKQRRRFATISDWRTCLDTVGAAPRCCCCNRGRS